MIGILVALVLIALGLLNLWGVLLEEPSLIYATINIVLATIIFLVVYIVKPSE